MDLRLLGPFDVEGPSGPVPLGATKERTLLALLALRPTEVVSMAQLVAGLWGDDPPLTAVKTVHGYVARVRKILATAGADAALVTRDPGYYLDVEPDTIDAVRFERHARSGRRALVDGDAEGAERELAMGLALWRGEALADCRQDSELIASEAVRLDELRVGAIEDHIDAQLALGQHNTVIGDLESMLSLYPLRERMWCSLMIALYRSQRQTDALRAFQRARETLIDTIGVEPGEDLRRLEAAILERDESLDLTPASPRTRAPSVGPFVGWTTTGPAFVGRTDELAALGTRWQRAYEGERQVVMLSGEPGIGKTRLASEVAVLAQRDGACALYGRCDEGLAVPYQPFVEALRSYVDRCEERELESRLGRYAGELVRLAPDLAPHLAAAPSPLQSDPGTEQYRLFEAVADWLATAAEAEPIALVLDDLHWAAQPTLLLLLHVMRNDRVNRMMVVGTYRQSEVDDSHPLTQMLADARVSIPVRNLERVELRGLDEAAVAEFVSAASDGRLDDEAERLAKTLHVETAGNPFFVNEIVRSLLESGALDVGRLDAPTLSELWRDRRVPPAARDVVLRRVDRLSTDAQHVLTTAAVVGADFEVPVLEQLVDLDPDALLAALEDATAARLIDEAEADRFTFAHEIVRGALYDRLSASRRVRLHGRVAAALELTHQHDLVDHLSALAYHYADADPSKAARYAIDAANDALDRLAFEDAAEICRRGFVALERVRGSAAAVAPADECDLLLTLGKAELRSGQPRGRVTLLYAFEVARTLNDEHRLAASVLAMNRGYFSRIGRTDAELVAALEHAIDAQPDGDTAELAELLATLASELTWAPDGDRRFELSDRAVSIARRVEDDRTLARVLLLRSMTIVAPDTLDERVALFRELREIAESLGDPAFSFESDFLNSTTVWEAGDLASLRGMQESTAALAIELGQPRLAWQAGFMGTSRLILEGRLDEAEAMAASTLELGQRAGQQAEAGIFHYEHTLEIRRWQGRLAELVDDFRQLVGVDEIDFGYALTRYLYDGGDVDHAAATYAAIRQRVHLPLRRDMLALPALYNLAYLATRLNDVDGARAFYPALLPHAATFSNTTVPRPVGAHLLGMLATTLGEPEQARAHFEAALRAHEAAEAPLLLAETQLELARLLAAEGAPEASALLDECRAAAVGHGAGFLLSGCADVEDPPVL